ncbi:MAG: FAD:protein FMN transferase, partial [Anaerolineae bacterium]|nr:FAD:protein FMN transferase [Anaerolineae bacterium]
MSDIDHLRFRAMGCEVNMQVEAEANRSAILSQMPGRVEALEARLSRFRPESELMQLNAQAGEWVPVSEVLFEVIHAAKHAARLTGGLVTPLVLPALIANGYDRSFEQIDHPDTRKSHPALDWRGIALKIDSRQVRLPKGSAIDLGGIAKGWAAAKLADELADCGPCLVDLGGDMVARGAPQGYAGWPVEIEDPE